MSNEDWGLSNEDWVTSNEDWGFSWPCSVTFDMSTVGVAGIQRPVYKITLAESQHGLFRPQGNLLHLRFQVGFLLPLRPRFWFIVHFPSSCIKPNRVMSNEDWVKDRTSWWWLSKRSFPTFHSFLIPRSLVFLVNPFLFMEVRRPPTILPTSSAWLSSSLNFDWVR